VVLTNSGLPSDTTLAGTCRQKKRLNEGAVVMVSLQEHPAYEFLALVSVACSGSGPEVFIFFEVEQPIVNCLSAWQCGEAVSLR